jgi:putative intracellular protease/amidase
VAIVVYPDAEPLDWTGPYEVYHDAANFGSVGGVPAFNVYIVSKSAEPMDLQGLQVTPNYSIADAPQPDIVLFPGGPAHHVYDDPEFFAWAERVSKSAEIAQSVCTGAFVLGKAGLLDGLPVTTFYGAIDGLRQSFPKAQVIDGRRYIDNGHVVTTAGISAGIDGSLHVVARLLGRRIADQVATYMEYRWAPESYLAQGYSYLNPSTDAAGRQLQTGELQLEQKDYAGAEATFRAALAAAPDNSDAWDGLGHALRGRGAHAEAATAWVRAAQGGGHSAGWRLYNAALEAAVAGDRERALATLERAFAAGYPNRHVIETEPAFAALRDDPRARRLVAGK